MSVTRGHHRQVVVRREHAHAHAPVVLTDSRCETTREARAVPRAVAVGRVVDAAQVDQLLERRAPGRSRSVAHAVEVVGRPSTIERSPRRARASSCLTRVAERAVERGLQGVELAHARHQRAMVLVRRILFCSCMMP